ncbi:hypothetical protein VRRI112168_16885 [Vreelandella rituensis]|uniref:Uncharacterized protein n=1 Tax=Vreelandella rituensis TaxID=2282306 RepID=A0A368TSH0_9GAMM|nr:hypothetical protein [Halomonas rituensis]RCV87719.1 hypothetical protein DU506_16190 [Halomonas rituensis]
MSPQYWLEAATLAFNLVGLVVCLVGLTLAQRMRRRWPGYLIALIGFLIAATPMFHQYISAMRYGQ